MYVSFRTDISVGAARTALFLLFIVLFVLGERADLATLNVLVPVEGSPVCVFAFSCPASGMYVACFANSDLVGQFYL